MITILQHGEHEWLAMMKDTTTKSDGNRILCDAIVNAFLNGCKI
jgi:hypothetical protein